MSMPSHKQISSNSCFNFLSSHQIARAISSVKPSHSSNDRPNKSQEKLCTKCIVSISHDTEKVGNVSSHQNRSTRHNHFLNRGLMDVPNSRKGSDCSSQTSNVSSSSEISNCSSRFIIHKYPANLQSNTSWTLTMFMHAE